MAQANSAAFRRNTDPFLIPIATGATGSQFNVPADFFYSGKGLGATSFYVVNPTKCWVRFMGSGQYQPTGATGNFTAVTENYGWLLGPGFQGAFTTQYPRYMSALAVKRQGIDPATALLPDEPNCLEVSYGTGS